MRLSIAPIIAFVMLGGSAATSPLTACLDKFGYPSVVDTCTKALRDFPANYPNASLDHANVYASRAMAWREMGERENAENDIAEAQKHAAFSEWVMFVRALLAYDAADYVGADRLLSDAISRLDEPGFFIWRAKALHKQGRLADAFADLDRAEGLAPEHAEVFFQRGVILADIGEFASAVRELTKSIALGERTKGLEVRHEVYIKLDQPDRAYDDLIVLTKTDDASAISWMFRAIFEVLNGRVEDAVRSADAGIAAWPDGVAADADTLHTLHLSRAGAFSKSGDPARAKPVIDAYVDEFGDTAQRRWNAFDMYREARLLNEALEILAGLDVEGSARSQVLRMKTRVHCELRDPAMTGEAFREWFAAFPEHVKVVLESMKEEHNLPATVEGMMKYIERNCSKTDNATGDTK